MSQRKTILLIDVDPPTRKYLENFTRLLGNYTVGWAAENLEIQAWINAFETALIIWDSSQIKKDGGQLFREIRKKYSSLQVLVMIESRQDEKMIKKDTLVETLTKPFDLKELSQKIKKLLPQDFARLLVADDEPGIDQLVEEILRPLGVEVFGASDGEDALQIFREKACNLALLDLRMPKIQGTELIQFLQTSVHPAPPKSIFLMSTALGDNLSELERMGFPILLKPIDLEILEQNILGACQKFELTLQKEKPNLFV